MVDQTNLAEIRHAVCRPDDSRRSMGAWKEESKVRRYGRTRHSQADSHGMAKSQSEELSKLTKCVVRITSGFCIRMIGF